MGAPSRHQLGAADFRYRHCHQSRENDRCATQHLATRTTRPSEEIVDPSPRLLHGSSPRVRSPHTRDSQRARGFRLQGGTKADECNGRGALDAMFGDYHQALELQIADGCTTSIPTTPGSMPVHPVPLGRLFGDQLERIRSSGFWLRHCQSLRRRPPHSTPLVIRFSMSFPSWRRFGQAPGSHRCAGAIHLVLRPRRLSCPAIRLPMRDTAPPCGVGADEWTVSGRPLEDGLSALSQVRRGIRRAPSQRTPSPLPIPMGCGERC